jgi:hypothetical protein
VPRGADVDDGGVVAAVAKLAGCVDRDGERYGESDADDGEWDNGVVDSDAAFGGGRWICEGGRGIATLGEARTACGPPLIGGSTTDVEGEDVFENDRLCVGWKYGSWADKPMRLSTGRPNYRARRKQPTKKGQEVGTNVMKTYHTRRLCWISSSLYISLSRVIRINSRSVSTRRLRRCSFSRRMASSMSSELGASGLGRRRRVGDWVPSPLTPVLLVPLPLSAGDPPFCCCCCCWLAASCCASRSAESSRERRFTCDSDSASSAFSSSIFSS